MIVRVSTARLAAVCLLILVSLLVIITGCSGNNPEQSTTSLSETTTSSTTAPVPQLSNWDIELKKTSLVQHDLATYLTQTGAPDDDPQRALFYGLKARIQALSCLKALEADDMEMADGAMLEVYYALNRAKTTATGTFAQTLADARAIVDTVGAPSDSPEEAHGLIDEFVTALAPLLDQVEAVLPSTTTTVRPATTSS